MDNIFYNLQQTLEQRKGASPDESYVSSLYAKGLDHILKKIGEETIEVVTAAKDGQKDKIIYEVADLLFHTLVLLNQQNIKIEEVEDELNRRFGLSGIEEKNNR